MTAGEAAVRRAVAACLRRVMAPVLPSFTARYRAYLRITVSCPALLYRTAPSQDSRVAPEGDTDGQLEAVSALSSGAFEA